MTLSLGETAPDFTLPATDGRTLGLSDVRGRTGTVVAFICNHCPYVVASVRRMVADAKALADEGVGFVAVCANDAARYPADGFERMQDFASQHGFPFPYLHDESQEVASAYGARVTPEFFGFDADGVLRYRGRMDAGTTAPPPSEAPRELLSAMRAIARDGSAPGEQHPARGCSIKWRT